MPEGGFGSKFGSIGSGNFIDTTMAGSPSSSIGDLIAASNAEVLSSLTPAMSSTSNSGLQFLKNTIADYQVAKTLIDSPMADVSAGINKTVLSSIGGKAASGVKSAGSFFSNIGSNIKYSKPVQSTLNAGSLTLAGLSGRKGLDYGLMATGFKEAPLGISPEQLRDSSWISNVFFPRDGSLFSKARSMPDLLREVEGQFSNASILPGSSQTGMIESYMDIINPKSTAGNNGYLDNIRTALINSGIKSPKLSSDNLHASLLLRQDLKGMLQTYYGESLYSSPLAGVVTDSEIGVRIARIVNNATDEWIGNGYTPSAIGIRGLAFSNYLKEFDSLGLAFNANEIGRTSLSSNLFETLTSPQTAQKNLVGSFKNVFASIQTLGKTNPGEAVDQLKMLLGSDHDIAYRFANLDQFTSTSQIPGMGPDVTELFPGGLTESGLSQIQRSARQYLLTSNLADTPDFAELVKRATHLNFSTPTTAGAYGAGTDLQDYAANSLSAFFPSTSDITPYKSSLYLKSRLKPEYFNQPGGGVIGSTNQLIVFDEIYRNLYESYRSGLFRLDGIESDSEAFPFWSPTWSDFNLVWENYLNDFIDAAAAPSVQGAVDMNEFNAIFDALQIAPQSAELDILDGVRSRLGMAFSGTELTGDLENLGINYFDKNTGILSFENLRANGARSSSGWFYGLRAGRGIQGNMQTTPVRTIDELGWEIANGTSNTFRSTAFAAPPPVSYNQPFVPISYTDSIRNTIDSIKNAGMTDTLPFNEFKLSDYFRTNADELNTRGGYHFSAAPPSWSYRNETEIQSLLDNSVSKGFMGGLTPMPDEFTNIVRTILPRQTGSFTPDQLNEFASAVWRDWTKTKGVLFYTSPKVDDFDITTYMQSPFDSKFYSALTQSSSVGDVFKNDTIRNFGATVGNEQINSGSTSKVTRGMYHLAGRMVPEIKKSLIQKSGVGILDHPALQSLSAIDVLKSRQFAQMLGLSNWDDIPRSALDNLDPNIFEGFPDAYRYLSTSSLFSTELPMTPKENEWLVTFADSMLRGPLDLSQSIPLPYQVLDAGLYSGLPVPGAPSAFIDPKFQFGSTSIENWLFDLVRGFDSVPNVTAAPMLRAKMLFFKSLDDYLNNKTVSGYYSDYFQSNPYINDQSTKDILKLINESAKIADAQVPDFPGTMSGSATRMTNAYQRSLVATEMLQSHKMASSSIVAQYSGDVSNYAQAIAEKTLPLAPLFPGRTNTISPFGMSPALSTDLLTPYFMSQMLTPSRLIELIGDGILDQGMIGSLMPEDKILGKIPKQYTKFGKMKINGYKTGGYVPGAPSTAIPAILHGGEYVINADAVRNMGIRTMQSINQSKFKAPSGAPAYTGGGGSTNVSTVNINVDTFIGEEEWFKGMMKDYNVNVLPRQQKAAGLESRTFTSYNGIQGGF
jgi:hypothetical protein